MQSKRPSVIYPPIVTWGMMTQRPHHLMRQFALNGCDAIFCNHREEFGKEREETDTPGLFVDYQGTKLEGPFDVFYTTWPRTHYLTEQYKPGIVLYDVCDRFPNWEEFVPAMVEKSTIITTSSSRIQAHMEADEELPVHLVRNACTSEHVVIPGTARKPVEDFGKDGRPVVGFVGAIAKWVDRDLLCKLSEEFNVVIVGPNHQAGPIPRAKNIGNVPFEGLPGFYASFDVGIVPFDRSEISLSADPIKAWEYLAAGLPVVSTPLPSMEDMDGNVRIAEPKDFIETVWETYRAQRSMEWKTKRHEFAKRNTWYHRGGQMLGLIKTIEDLGVTE